MGWRRRGRGGNWYEPWPGRGPFSYLPPWQRPGWLYGRGACRWFLAQYPRTTIPQIPATMPATSAPQSTKEQEKQMLEQQAKVLESQLEVIRKRLEELDK